MCGGCTRSNYGLRVVGLWSVEIIRSRAIRPILALRSEKDNYSGQVTQKKNDIPLPVLVLRPQSPYKMLDVLRSEYNAG